MEFDSLKNIINKGIRFKSLFEEDEGLSSDEIKQSIISDTLKDDKYVKAFVTKDHHIKFMPDNETDKKYSMYSGRLVYFE